MYKRKLGEEEATYGRLTVVKRAESNRHGQTMWLCKCECGGTVTVLGTSLRQGATKSCGCLRREATGTAFRTHGMCTTLLYHVWSHMVSRCTNTRAHAYEHYGGRGITVCPEWRRPEQFLKWAFENGYRRGLEIDRRDNDGNYTPENCRFVTRTVNVVNRGKFSSNTSGYTGVHRRKSGRYRAFVAYEGVTTWVGSFPTAWGACQARNQHIRNNSLPHKIQEEIK